MFWKHSPNSTYTRLIRHYSMSSVRCGMKSLKEQGTEDLTPFLSVFSNRSVVLTSPYIKVPILPLLHSVLLPPFPTQFCIDHHHIPPQQAKKPNIIAGPSSHSNPMTTSERRET